jgi:hypothetical protein
LIFFEVCFNASPLLKLNRNLNTSKTEIALYPFISVLIKNAHLIDRLAKKKYTRAHAHTTSTTFPKKKTVDRNSVVDGDDEPAVMTDNKQNDLCVGMKERRRLLLLGWPHPPSAQVKADSCGKKRKFGGCAFSSPRDRAARWPSFLGV